MPGRKKPEMTEEERRREYRLFQKRSYGEVEPLSGVPAEVEREREAWREAHEARSKKS